jgi:sugar phosphate isomerase/epimerase
MELTIGCTTRPFRGCSFGEACKYIAEAGYTDVGFVPVKSDNTAEELARTRKTATDAGLNPSMALSRPKMNLGLDAASSHAAFQSAGRIREHDYSGQRDPGVALCPRIAIEYGNYRFP